MNCLDALLAQQGHLLADGAMGTRLFDVGLPAGDAPERWNLDQPDAIAGIHQSYVLAGSDIVLTNTFGGSRFRLQLHGLENRVREVNEVAAQIARSVADEVDRKVLVAGSIGPTGGLLAPLGSIRADEAEEAFAEQAAGLADGGVDLLWFETLSALEEVEAGVLGARRAANLPVVVTMSYDTASHTMMGVKGSEAGPRLAKLGVAAVGANCGANLSETEDAIAEIVDACRTIPVVAKANAGIPIWKGSELVFDGTPEVMAIHADRARRIGASIIGACCGSTPDHIALMSRVLNGEVSVADLSSTVADMSILD